MWQELLHLPGGITIHGYGLMVLLGALSGAFLLKREAARRGWDTQRVVDIAVLSVVLGLVGARAFYVIQFYPSQFRGEPFWHVFAFWKGGLVLYGGMIAGISVFVVLVKRAKLPVLGFMDAAAPSLALGIAFGRIGCFLNGCCWGRECSAEHPLAVIFPAEAPAGGVPVLPTQLFSSAHAFLLAFICYRLQRSGRGGGAVIGTMLVLYGIGRFMIESIRGDHTPQFEFTVSQLVSFATVAVGVGLWLYSRLSKAEVRPAQAA